MSANRLKSGLIGTSAAVATLFGLAGVPAHATTVDNINLPGGATITAEIVEETLISKTGQSLTGIGIISSITGPSLIPSYTYGEGGEFLTFAFNNFTSSFVLAPNPIAGTAGYVEFTGGTPTVYEETSAPNLATGSQATDYSNATSGTQFLGLTAQTFGTNAAVQSAGGPATTTLEATIPSNDTLLAFSNAGGSAYFDATSGPAAFAFQTCAFSVPGVSAGGVCPTGEVDTEFTESFNAPVAGDFPVSGTASVKAVLVPEPVSISLFGIGLIALGGMSRRRRSRT